MNLGPGPCDKAAILNPTRTAKVGHAGSWVLVVSILGSSMAFIDGTAVNVALPALQTSLGASMSDVQWVVESYTLFLSALLLTGGSLGDLYGERKVFLAGVALFAAASVWCGLAPNVQQLVTARAVQGAGGALLVPASLALLSVSFPREQLGRVIGTWSGATSITSSAGPLLGGWLSQHASWRWVFFLNIPIALAVIAVVLWRLKGRDLGTPSNARRLDWTGTVLAALGLGGIVFGLIQKNFGAATLGALCLAGFIYAERKARQSMLPLVLFRSRNFAATQFLTLCLYGALSGALFFLPMDLVQVQGYSETAAGAALLPLILLIAFLSRWSAGLLDRFQARHLLTIGPGIAALGFVLLGIGGVGASYWTAVLPSVIVLGFGMALTVAPLTTTVMRSVDAARAGIASGVNNAASRVAGLVTIALFGSVLTFVFNMQVENYESMDPQAGQYAIDRQRSKLAAAELPADEKVLAKESFDTGFRWVSFLAAGLALCGATAGSLVEGRPRSLAP